MFYNQIKKGGLYMVNLSLWKEQKKKLRLSLQDIADMTDISISTLKDIFRGATTDPRIETVQRIENALGLTATQEQTLSVEEKQLVSLIAELTDEEVKELSNYVDYIISKREK
jgi:transcriptional regulator with XRE-family HTH domain